MARSTEVFTVMPWTGGINTSVDSGVLNAQELVEADNVVFSSTGARIKREALEYLDNTLEAPNRRSSSGTTRTLIWANSILCSTLLSDERLVVGEKITVTGEGTISGDSNYVVDGAPILSRSAIAAVTKVTTFADISSSLNNTSFFISAGDPGTDYYVWFNVGGAGVDPGVSGRTGIEVAISVNDSADAVATALGAALTASGDFTTSVLSDEVTITAALAGYTAPSSPNNSGFIIEVLNSGGYSITYDGPGSYSESEVSALGLSVTRSAKVVGYHDYWRFDTDATDIQLSVYANSDGQLFYLDGTGNRQQIQPADDATVPENGATSVRFLTYNEALVIFFSEIGDMPCYWNPDDDPEYQLMPNAPDASFGFIHLGRIWANDKSNKGRIHFCETFDATLWMGLGDSGALDIWPGDGDPEGINNGYSYKGMAIIGKKAKRYRILGDSPEDFFVELISSGMGNEGPLAIPVDQGDVVFMSRRGLHSQQTTDQYGDVDAAYMSADIKTTFNSWAPALLKYSQGAYIPELNSIAISIAEHGNSEQNAVWLYNFEVQVPGKDRPGAWYRWPDISCTALGSRFVNGVNKLIFGTGDGRIIQAQTTDSYADFGTDGILYRIKTGTIYPGGDPQSMKAFKKISTIFRPKGNFSFSLQAKIDNHLQQTFSFDQASGLDLLGESFVLGTSVLGASNALAPFTYTMEGVGRGIVLTLTQPDADEQIELWGFIIEYENLDLEQETD